MIIETKLYVPGTKGPLINRDHLFEKLDKGLDYKLTLLTAATGNGKSTLLGEWTATIPHVVAWVSLDSNDNHISVFWMHMVASLQSIFPEMDRQFTREYIEEDPSGVTLIAKVLNYLNQLSEQLVLIWDDFHSMNNEPLLDSIDYFLKRLSGNVHVYIAGRSEPKLSLSRLRVKGNLNELDANDFKLNKREIKLFFEQSTNLHLDEAMIAFIETRTEGWIAGLRMIALLLYRCSEQGLAINQELLESVTGGHNRIADYFIEEVFMEQPKEVQLFLLQTSILKRMNGPLIEAVTDAPNGLASLKYLEKENLFLVSLDYKHEWFRYHHLFQEFLQMELDIQHPEMKFLLHNRAAKWLENKGSLEEALDHYLAARNYDTVVRLLNRINPSLLPYERFTLSKSLNKIPNQLLFHFPTLYLTNLAFLFLSGYIKEATEKYWWAIQTLESAELELTKKEIEQYHAGLDFLVTFRCFLEKDFSSFVIYSRKYLSKVPKGNLFINYGSDKNGYHVAWEIYMSEESLDVAGALLPEVLELWSKTENEPFYAHLCIDYGRYLYEKGQLRQVEHYAECAMEIGRKYNNMGLIANSTFLLAKMEVVTQRREKAKARLIDLQKEILPPAHPVIGKKIMVFQKFLLILEENITELSSYIAEQKMRSSDEISSVLFDEYYLFVHILGLQGKKSEAICLINRLLDIAVKENKQQAFIRFTLYKSRLLKGQDKLLDSFFVLEEALAMGEREGYIRTFLDEGVALESLLEGYISAIQKRYFTYSKKAYFNYAKQLKALLLLEPSLTSREKQSGDKPLYEVLLTAKEQIVLIYIDQGLSNREIAAELDVSLSTVKTHINHLYRKLNVTNRVLAIQTARDLGII